MNNKMTVKKALMKSMTDLGEMLCVLGNQ